MGLSAGKRLLTSDTAKKIGSSMLDIGKDAAKNLAVDLLEGKNLDESLSKEMQSAKAKIASRIKGAGRKRKKSICKGASLKKLKYSLLD